MRRRSGQELLIESAQAGIFLNARRTSPYHRPFNFVGECRLWRVNVAVYGREGRASAWLNGRGARASLADRLRCDGVSEEEFFFHSAGLLRVSWRRASWPDPFAERVVFDCCSTGDRRWVRVEVESQNGVCKFFKLNSTQRGLRSATAGGLFGEWGCAAAACH